MPSDVFRPVNRELDSMSKLGEIKNLTAAHISRGMKICVATACLNVVWSNVCSIQPIFTVYFRNILDGSASQLGLLVSLIQLSAVCQLISIFIYGTIRRRKVVFVVFHIAHRILTLAIALSAILAARQTDSRITTGIVTVAMALSWMCANTTTSGWWSWVADLFPENIRGAFFLKRSSIQQTVNVIWFFLASALLDIARGENLLAMYTFIFSVGALSGIMDILLNIWLPEPIIKKPPFTIQDFFEPIKNRNFVQFAATVGFTTFSLNMIGPFQSPYVVSEQHIGAPNTWLGIMFVMQQLTWVITAPFWGVVMDKWGRKPVVTMGTLLAAGWVGYLFLTPGNYFIILPLISILYGALAPAYYEGVNQMMLSLSPNKNRIAYISWYGTIVGLVSSGGSLFGGMLSDALTNVSVQAGPLTLTNFHIVQLMSICLVLFCGFLLSRVKEGRESFGFVVAQVTNPRIFSTYQRLSELKHSNDPEHTSEILRSINKSSGELVLADIINCLSDPDSEVQEEAARALGRMKSAKAVEPLIEILLDSNSVVRTQAARSLGKIKDKRAVQPLIKTMWESSDELQVACLEALAKIGDVEGLEHIESLLKKNQSPQLRSRTNASAAANTGFYEAVLEIVPNLLGAKNSILRKQYAIAIANIIGVPGEFYQYTISTGATERKIHKLCAQFQRNMRVVEQKLHARGRLLSLGAETIVAEYNAEDYGKCINEINSLVNSLCRQIFGDSLYESDPLETLYRIDQSLGIFVWFIRYVTEFQNTVTEDAAAGELYRLITLLSIYYLGKY